MLLKCLLTETCVHTFETYKLIVDRLMEMNDNKTFFTSGIIRVKQKKYGPVASNIHLVDLKKDCIEDL